AGRFRVLGSGDAAELVPDLLDLRATISSHPVIPKLFRSLVPTVAWRREQGSGVLFAIASATNPGRLPGGLVCETRALQIAKRIGACQGGRPRPAPRRPVFRALRNPMPFAVFRRHQRKLLALFAILAMFGFVLAD